MNRCSSLALLIVAALVGGGTAARAENMGGRVLIWGRSVPSDGSQMQETKVLRLAGLDITNAIAVAAGDDHTLVLLSDGKVVGMGNNKMGQAFAGNGQLIGWVPVTNSKALRFESTYQPRGEGLVSLGTNILTEVTAISARVYHSIAVRKDGSVAGWGANYFSEQFVVPLSLGSVISAACGRDGDWFLLRDGSLVELRRGLTQPVIGLSNVVMIAGTTHDRSRFVALRSDGQVCSGSVREGVEILENFGSDVKALAAGGWQILALHANGKVTAQWGHTPEDLSNITAVAVGEYHSLALKADGTVASWANERRRQVEVPTGLSNVVAIAAGNSFSLAITTNAAVAERFMPKSK